MKEQLIEFAKSMRRQPTNAEAIIWATLRGARMQGCLKRTMASATLAPAWPDKLPWDAIEFSRDQTKLRVIRSSFRAAQSSSCVTK